MHKFKPTLWFHTTYFRLLMLKWGQLHIWDPDSETSPLVGSSQSVSVGSNPNQLRTGSSYHPKRLGLLVEESVKTNHTVVTLIMALSALFVIISAIHATKNTYISITLNDTTNLDYNRIFRRLNAPEFTCPYSHLPTQRKYFSIFYNPSKYTRCAHTASKQWCCQHTQWSASKLQPKVRINMTNKQDRWAVKRWSQRNSPYHDHLL